MLGDKDKLLNKISNLMVNCKKFFNLYYFTRWILLNTLSKTLTIKLSTLGIERIYIYIYIYKVVQGDPKAPFSIASTPRNREGASPFSGLLHFTLDSYRIMLSVKLRGIKYQFFESLVWFDQEFEPRSRELLANTSPTTSFFYSNFFLSFIRPIFHLFFVLATPPL